MDWYLPVNSLLRKKSVSKSDLSILTLKVRSFKPLSRISSRYLLDGTKHWWYQLAPSAPLGLKKLRMARGLMTDRIRDPLNYLALRMTRSYINFTGLIP